MFSCHEGMGLGHLRRTLALSRHLRERWPALSQLVVTSSAGANSLAWPEDLELVKLPSVLRVRQEEHEHPFEARLLPLSFESIRALRRDMLLSIARHLEPRALIVDYMPAGLKGDVVPALRYLKERGQTRLILGLRDILDAGARVRRAWEQDGVYELLDELYDLILVYGQRDIYDVAAETGLSPRATAKLRYVGYLRAELDGQSPEQLRAELRLQTERLVLVTVGGGTAGYQLLATVLEALRLTPGRADFDCLLVAGPLMPAADRRRLRELIPPGAPVRLLDSVGDLTGYIAAADAVVSRAGYNSVCEVLSFARPTLLIPWAVQLDGMDDNQEQPLRAQVMSRRGLTRMLHPAELTPDRLLRELVDLLEQPAPSGVSLDFNGLPASADALGEVLGPVDS